MSNRLTTMYSSKQYYAGTRVAVVGAPKDPLLAQVPECDGERLYGLIIKKQDPELSPVQSSQYFDHVDFIHRSALFSIYVHLTLMTSWSPLRFPKAPKICVP